MINEGEWAEACAALTALVEDAGLMARLAEQGEHLEAWRAGDSIAGGVAADALDQLSGLLDDSEFVEARRAIAYLRQVLPPGLDT